MNDLHTKATEYLTIRRALGFKLRGYDRLLTGFIEFLTQAGASTPTTVLAVAWATEPAGRVQPVRCAQRFSVVRGFTRYLHGLDPTVQVPPPDVLSGRREHRDPYLYSPEDIAALMAAARTLTPPFRAVTYHAVFGLLAVTGMRISEAIHLDLGDVDLDTGTLTIRNTKFGKFRRLPLHPTTTNALRDYATRRDVVFPPANAGAPSFFVSTRGTPLIYRGAQTAFSQMLARADLRVPQPGPTPKIHGLRHSFAVATLHDWYRDPAQNVMGKIPILSAYLGHAHPASTYWYLSHGSGIASDGPSFLASAARRLERSTESGEQ